MELYRNRNAILFLVIAGVALLAGWVVGVALYAALVREPSPLVPLAGAVWLVGGWAFLVSRIPIVVEISQDTLVLRRLLSRKKLERSQINGIEYRILAPYLDRPVDLRYYTISVLGQTKRLAEFGADGRIAQRLMTWFDPLRSTLKVYQGRELVEERPIQP